MTKLDDVVEILRANLEWNAEHWEDFDRAEEARISQWKSGGPGNTAQFLNDDGTLKLQKEAKEFFDQDQPRVPAGSPEGGQWASINAVPGIGSFGALSSKDPSRDLNAIETARDALAKAGVTPQAVKKRFDDILKGESAADIKKWGDWYGTQFRAEVDRLASKYGITVAQAGGVLAALSPQMKWGDNIDSRYGEISTKNTPDEDKRDWKPGDIDRNNQWAAESIISDFVAGTKFEVTEAHLEKAAKEFATKEILRQHYGKDVDTESLTLEQKLAAIPSAHVSDAAFFASDPVGKSFSLQELPDQIAAVVHRGEGISGKKPGEKFFDPDKPVLVQSVRNNYVAMSILKGVSPDAALNGFKVRSFYNNGMRGSLADDDVTINGHMAALMMGRESIGDDGRVIFFGGKGEGPKGAAHYTVARHMIRDYFESNKAKYGWKSPKEAQAALWGARRKKLGEAAWAAQYIDESKPKKKAASEEEDAFEVEPTTADDYFEDMRWARMVDWLQGFDVSGYDDILGPWTKADEDEALKLGKKAASEAMEFWDETEHPRHPSGSPEGGQFAPSGGGGGGGGGDTAQQDLKFEPKDQAREGAANIEKLLDDAIENTRVEKEIAPSSPVAWSDLEWDAQNNVHDKWLEEQFENGIDVDTSELDKEFEDDLRKENEDVVEEAEQKLLDDLSEKFPHSDPRLPLPPGETWALYRKLDPDSIVLGEDDGDGAPIEADELRFTNGEELTADEKAEVVAHWQEDYREEFQSALEKKMESDDYYEARNELEGQALDEAWRDMSSDDKLQLAVKYEVEIPWKEGETVVEEGPPARWVIGVAGEGDSEDAKRTRAVANELVNLRTRELLGETLKGERKLIAEAEAAWSKSPTSPEAQALQLAVATELGGSHQFTPEQVKTIEASSNQIALRAYARAQWETTQFLMEQSGHGDVTVYRAVVVPSQHGVDSGDLPEKINVSLKNAGMTSTTLSADVANKWRVPPSEGIKNPARAVLRFKVPASSVFSVPVFGKGNKEVILTGPRDNWDFDAWLGSAPDINAVPIRSRR